MTADPYRFRCADGARMDEVGTGSVDLVLTSPPYWPAGVEAEIRRPWREQDAFARVEQEMLDFARAQTTVFAEIARTLRADGILVVQTKEIRNGRYLIGVRDAHRRLAEEQGFRLLTQIGWIPEPGTVKRRAVARSRTLAGTFVVMEPDWFLVFSRGDSPGLHPPLPTSNDDLDPVWYLPGQGSRTTHPQESPLSVLRRLVERYSRPGDLVLDPFCGHGTTVVAAVELGRRAVGYDIDPAAIAVAEERLKRVVMRMGRAG